MFLIHSAGCIQLIIDYWCSITLSCLRIEVLHLRIFSRQEMKMRFLTETGLVLCGCRSRWRLLPCSNLSSSRNTMHSCLTPYHAVIDLTWEISSRHRDERLNCSNLHRWRSLTPYVGAPGWPMGAVRRGPRSRAGAGTLSLSHPAGVSICCVTTLTPGGCKSELLSFITGSWTFLQNWRGILV